MKEKVINRYRRRNLIKGFLFVACSIVAIVSAVTWSLNAGHLNGITRLLVSSPLFKIGEYKYMYGPANIPFVAEDTFNQTLKEKYFIYSCDGFGWCGGLADRQEGIVATYLISQMLGRKFGIRFTVPCDISTYLSTHLVNWTVDNENIRSLSNKTEYVLDRDAWRLREQMVSMDLDSAYPQDVVNFRVNQEFVQYLMKNKHFSSVKWAFNLKVPDIYNIVYRRLFQLKPKLNHQFEEFQTLARRNNRKLICTQVRVYRNPTIPNDYDPKEKVDLTIIWDFLNKYNHSSRYSIFVSSDSEEVRHFGARLYPDAIVDVGGSIVHIERSSGAGVCSGFAKVILDQLVLSTCDVLLLTDSGVGRIASFLRGTSQGLYCVYRNTLKPCSPFDPQFIPYNW